jgi:hypothetical protein
MDNQAKVEELMQKEEFVGKLSGCGNAKEIRGLFEQNGIAVSEEEAAELQKILAAQKAEAPKKGLLSDDDLEGVAGGLSMGSMFIDIEKKVLRWAVKTFSK